MLQHVDLDLRLEQKLWDTTSNPLPPFGPLGTGTFCALSYRRFLIVLQRLPRRNAGFEAVAAG